MDDYYTEVDADEVKENSETIQSNDYQEYGEEHTHDTRKNEELRSKYDNIEERSQDESDEGGRHLITIDDTDISLPIADDQRDDDAGTDFHAFWKGEGNARAIREAQDIRRSKNHAQVHGQGR